MAHTVRVRFAPSPTGHLHIGGARTAIYNWAFARHAGGTFVLRIDDTDPERSTPENTAAILRALRWLGLDWDEGPEAGGESGPYFQTQRVASYTAALDRLKADGNAYPCFCSPEELERKRDLMRAGGGYAGYDRACRRLPRDEALSRVANGAAHVWRIAVPEERGDVVFDDAIRGDMRFPGDAMDDFVLVRSDGTPTYNFATVVDDWNMGITHVVRGEDHLSNTPRQIIVFEALGAPVPAFAHMSLIFGADGKRLSKRHGATSVEAYRDQGYLPEALLNYLALLGWSIDDKTTLFDRETLVREFDIARVSRNPAVWDPEKLEWMNGVYIREMAPAALAERMGPWLVGAGLIAEADLSSTGVRDMLVRLAPLVSERLRRLDEVVPWVRFLFVSEDALEIDESASAKVLTKPLAVPVLQAAADRLGALGGGEWNAARIEAALRELPEELGVKAKEVFQPVRVATSGATVSPPLFESLDLLGKERTLSRLRKALERARGSLDTNGGGR